MLDTKSIRYFNPDEVFKLNPQMKINKYNVGGFPVIVVDDFYLNPYLVREVAISTPMLEKTNMVSNAFTGRRGYLNSFIENYHFFDLLTKILLKGLEMETLFKEPEKIIMSNQSDFVINCYEGNENFSNKIRANIPHVDPSLAAALIYLNTEEEEQKGTGIYKYKPNNIICAPNTKAQLEWCSKFKKIDEEIIKKDLQEHLKLYYKEDKLQDFILESNEKWEKIFETEAKFNQMVLYPGSLYHSPLIDYKKLAEKKIKRINQVLFLNPYYREIRDDEIIRLIPIKEYDLNPIDIKLD